MLRAGTSLLHRRARSASATVRQLVTSTSSAPGPDITLFQYQICPFCNKVKAVLDHSNVPYRRVEVDPLGKGELSFSKDYRKVPVALVDGAQVNGHDAIVDHLVRVGAVREDQLGLAQADQNKDDDGAQKWFEWADTLAVMVYPNITRSLRETVQAFGYMDDVPTFGMKQKIVSKYVGAAAMRLANGKLKKKYGIEDERASLATALEAWTSHLTERRESGVDGPFAGGAAPHLGDLGVYGVLRAIDGLDAHGEIMATDERLATWYADMKEVVGPSASYIAEA